MSVLSTVGREDVMSYLLAMPWVMLVGMVALCCTAEDRRACFRRWSPWLVLVGGLGVFFCGMAWMSAVQAKKESMRFAAQSEAKMIEGAAKLFAGFSDYRVWPSGENREVVATLMKPMPSQRESYLEWYRVKVRLGADGSALDPWGRAYLMESRGEEGLRVWSAGPDGVSGTKDDVSGL